MQPDCARIIELKRLVADLEARLPAHSVPPAMAQRLEELEEELERLQRAQANGLSGHD